MMMTGEDHRHFVVMNKSRQRAPIPFIFIQPWISISSPPSSLQQVVVILPSIVLRDSEKKKKELSRRYVEFHLSPRQRDHDDEPNIKRESGDREKKFRCVTRRRLLTQLVIDLLQKKEGYNINEKFLSSLCRSVVHASLTQAPAEGPLSFGTFPSSRCQEQNS